MCGLTNGIHHTGGICHRGGHHRGAGCQRQEPDQEAGRDDQTPLAYGTLLRGDLTKDYDS